MSEALQQVLTSLNRLSLKPGATSSSVSNGSAETSANLKTLLERRDMQALVQVHKIISESEHSKQHHAKAKDALQTFKELSSDLRDYLNERAEVGELFELLTRPHFNALLEAHDRVAQEDFEPKLPPQFHEVGKKYV